MKKTLCVLSLSLLCAPLAMFSLTSCNTKVQLDTPTDITFDYKTGKFSFTGVENAKTYTVGISEIINDTTGAGLVGINNASQLTMPDGTKKYVWGSQIASATGVADQDGDGKVEGTLIYRSFSSTAADPGQVVDYTQIPIGDYVMTVMADANSEAKLAGSEYAMLEFSINGTLPDPEGFTSSFDGNKMTIKSASNYFINALSTKGMPDEMKIVIKEDGTAVDTITIDDFSYTNTVIGPAKSYTFTYADTVTSTKELDKTKKITATIQAVGKSSSKTSSKECDVAVETTTDAVTYATKLDCSGSGTAGSATININVGTDANGANIYGLEVKVGSVAVARESGTFTVPAGTTVTQLDNKNTYPEATVLTFATSASDLATSIMDGKTLTVEKKESRGWQGTTIDYALTGEGFTYNGTTFAFTGAASSGGPGGGGPGGPF